MGVNKINGIAVASIAKINGKTVESYTKINGQTISSTPPAHSPMWVAVGGTKLAYSTDAIPTGSWTEITVTGISAFKDLTFGKNANGTDTWYGCSVVDNSGVMYSTDPADAASWTVVNPEGTGGGTAIEYGASETIVLGREHENHAMRYSTDYGVSWTDATINSANNAKACDSIATNGEGLWMAGMGTLGVILKSYDDGINWYKSADLGSDKHIGMEYANGVWVATEQGETINTCTSVAESNTTDTWTQTSPPTWNRPGDAITHVTDSTWMIGGTRRNVYKSVDNASTWSAVTSLPNYGGGGTNNNAYSMASDGTTVVATGRNGYINVSTDLGNTWTTPHTMSANQHMVAVEYNKVKPF